MAGAFLQFDRLDVGVLLGELVDDGVRVFRDHAEAIEVLHARAVGRTGPSSQRRGSPSGGRSADDGAAHDGCELVRSSDHAERQVGAITKQVLARADLGDHTVGKLVRTVERRRSARRAHFRGEAYLG